MKKWLILLLLTHSLAFASTNISSTNISKVIAVKYVSPDVLVKTLTPMLQPDESISTFENNLVVNVSPETLTKIRPIIHQLDQPKPVFQISVHQDSDNWLNDGYQEADVYSTQDTNAKKDNQSIQVLSGASAYVSTANNYPVVQSAGIGWGFGVSYERMQSEKGFIIKPSLQGDKVLLSIKRQYSEQDQVNNQSANQGLFETTTIVPLDQWVKLGEMQGADRPSNGSSYSFHAGGSYADKGSLFIKISIIGK